MTDVIIKDGETNTTPIQESVAEGVKVAEQIIETAQVLKAQDDNRMIDLLHDVVSRLNHLTEKLDGVDGKLDRVEMQVINNTISVENVIDDLSDVADDVEEVIEEAAEEVNEDIPEAAIEKQEPPAIEITESVEVREGPKKKKRVWL